MADPLLHAARACHAGPVTGYHWSVGTFDGALWRVIEADFAVRPMGTQD